MSVFGKGGAYIGTSVRETGGLSVELVGSFIKGPCPGNRWALA